MFPPSGDGDRSRDGLRSTTRPPATPDGAALNLIPARAPAPGADARPGRRVRDLDPALVARPPAFAGAPGRDDRRGLCGLEPGDLDEPVVLRLLGRPRPGALALLGGPGPGRALHERHRPGRLVRDAVRAAGPGGPGRRRVPPRGGRDGGRLRAGPPQPRHVALRRRRLSRAGRRPALQRDGHHAIRGGGIDLGPRLGPRRPLPPGVRASPRPDRRDHHRGPSRALVARAGAGEVAPAGAGPGHRDLARPPGDGSPAGPGLRHEVAGRRTARSGRPRRSSWRGSGRGASDARSSSGGATSGRPSGSCRCSSPRSSGPSPGPGLGGRGPSWEWPGCCSAPPCRSWSATGSNSCPKASASPAPSPWGSRGASAGPSWPRRWPPATGSSDPSWHCTSSPPAASCRACSALAPPSRSSRDLGSRPGRRVGGS